jgi:hypothetical protein
MPFNRRTFLLAGIGAAAALSTEGVRAIARTLAASPQAKATATVAAGAYGAGVRAQVFEVVVRQAIAGAPWREICDGPMRVNNIEPGEVEAEVARRQYIRQEHPNHRGNESASCPVCIEQRWAEIRKDHERGEHTQHSYMCSLCMRDRIEHQRKEHELHRGSMVLGCIDCEALHQQTLSAEHPNHEFNSRCLKCILAKYRRKTDC